MGLFEFFKKKEKAPRDLRPILDKMKLHMEGRKLADEAISYRNFGDYGKAFQLLETSLRDYNYTPAITLIGTTKVLQGDINGAIQWFLKHLNTVSTDAYPILELYANLGSIYNKYLNAYSEALQMYEKALEMPRPRTISEDNYRIMVSMVHHDMAIVYDNLGELSLARDYAKRRLEVVPDCPDCTEIVLRVGNSKPEPAGREPGNLSISHTGRSGRRQSHIVPADSIGFLRVTWRMYLEELISDATRENAPEQLKTDLQITLKWLGIGSVEEIDELQFEQFSHGFEAYLREKKTPVAAMWYKSLESLLKAAQAVPYKGNSLNEEICGVMDRLIATDKQSRALESQWG